MKILKIDHDYRTFNSNEIRKLFEIKEKPITRMITYGLFTKNEGCVTENYLTFGKIALCNHTKFLGKIKFRDGKCEFYYLIPKALFVTNDLVICVDCLLESLRY